ncbi:MAG: FoF1 ATP synthase subunit gamma, partial [Limnochordia bacterium]
VIFLYLHMCLFAAFTEAHTSEQAARMVSMDAAQKNAEEMIEKLIHMYNRKRQAAITQELSEIIGGSNIINKGDPDDKEYR